MDKTKGKIHYAWLILVGLCLMVGLGRGGLNNSASLFLTPVTEDLGIGMGSLSLYFSVASVITMLCLPIAGKLMAKYDIRLILTIAVICQAGSFAMFGLMNSVWGWYIFAMPLSFGSIFIIQMAGPVLINQWFKKHNGLAIGIMMASSGALGAIIQPIVGKLIVNQGWRSSYITVGLFVMIVSTVVILLFIRKPQDKKMLPYGAEEQVVQSNEKAKGASENKGISLAIAKKSSAFYALILFFFLITSFGSFAMHIPSYAIGLGYDVAFAGIVALPIYGYIFEFTGSYTGALYTMLAMMIIAIGCIVVAYNSKKQMEKDDLWD